MPRNPLKDRRFGRSKVTGSVPDFMVEQFEGLITAVKDTKSMAKGASQDSNNWLTGDYKDHIELRMGTRLLGSTRQLGSGKVTGIGVGTKNDGTEVLFFTHGRKLKYYDVVSDDNVESGSNLFPAAADGEDITIEPYNNIAGAFVYLSSPNSSIYKVPVANPGSPIDQASATYKGYIKIKQNRTYLYNNKVTATGFTDKTGLFLSHIDKSLFSQYTTISAESVGTGTGAQVTFTGTLAFKAAGTKRSCFNVVITDSTEIFRDDKNGVLVGSAGGTGTINYSTGEFSITFNTAPTNLQAITAEYNWEDSTSSGICDFTYSTPRTAGQGSYFRQDDGGGSFMGILSIGAIDYCLHVLKTWALTLTATDTGATNLHYRKKVGAPYHRAMNETGDGGYYLDFTDKNDPKLRILEPGIYTTDVKPNSLSDVLDLSRYGFDYPVVYEWGNYIILSCQRINSGVNENHNGVTLVYNKVGKVWDKLDFAISCLAEYNSRLVAGDPLSNNCFYLFDGYDDDGEVISNHWISGELDLGIKGTKRFYRFVIDGYIATTQKLKISIQADAGNFTEIGGEDDDEGNHIYAIEGDGDYVDTGTGILVGSTMVGSDVVGGGGDGVNAYHFAREFTVASDIAEHFTVKFEAQEVGALQINNFGFKDIRYKGRKKANQYVS